MGRVFGALKRFMFNRRRRRRNFFSVFQGVKMFVPQLWRSAWTRVNRLRPRYSLVISSVTAKSLEEVTGLVSAGRLKPVLDHRSPFPFTADGVKDAFELQASKRAHGKVVIAVVDQDRSGEVSAGISLDVPADGSAVAK